MYPDPITPRAHPHLLSRVGYDPFGVMPGDLPPAPRVYATSAQLSRARTRCANGIEADRQGLAKLVESCRIDEPLPPFKDTGGPPDWGGPLLPWLNLAFRNALAAALTDDARHRQRALEAMRLAAQAAARVPAWTGHEHNEAIAAARAYDLLAASSLEPADDNAFRDMLWIFIAALNRGEHVACNNHNAMNMVGRLSIAAALGHRQWIHDTFYGLQSNGRWRYGLIHTLRHDFLADGMQWEGALGYHKLVVGMVCECFTIMSNLGVDLWKRVWPATLKDEGFDEHRGWGPKGGKLFSAAFDALLYQAFANGDYSMLHDSGLRNLRDSGTWWLLFNKAWEVYGDPRYAWALKHINRGSPARADGPVPVWFEGHLGSIEFVRIEARDIPDGEHPLTADRPISISGRHVAGCSLFPVHGSAVLRSDPADDRAPGAFLYWGPHWAGHRSPASLHLDVHACGRCLTVSPHVSSGYSDPRHLTWNRTTIAHNTVTVDETPMFPYDFEGDSIWEYDFWRDSISDGTLVSFQTEPNFKSVRAANDNVYPGVRLDRTVILTRDALLDVYRVDAERPRRLDWAMHCSPDIDFRCAGGEPVDLGNRRGYRHLTGAVRHPQYYGWIVLPIQVGETVVRLCLWLDGAPGTELLLARDPAPLKNPTESKPEPDANRSALLLRTQAASTCFVAYWSFDGRDAAVEVRERGAASDLRIDVRHGTRKVAWHLPYDGQVCRATVG